MSTSLAAGPYPLWTIADSGPYPGLELPFSTSTLEDPEVFPTIAIFSSGSLAARFAAQWPMPPHEAAEVPSPDELRRLLEFFLPAVRQVAIDPLTPLDVKHGHCRFVPLAQLLAAVGQP